MIAYSQQSRRAIGRLFRPYNDIDVYVEDSSYRGVYEKYINRVLHGRAKVSKVIPLGPKSKVISDAQADTSPGGRPRLYIVDGDLDLIAWRRQRSASRLYRLRVYALENLFVTQEALGKYCDFASLSVAGSDCRSNVDVPDLIVSVEELLPYMTLLAVAHRLSLRSSVTAINPPSVSRKVNDKLHGSDSARIRQRCREMISFIISQVGVKRYRVAKAAVKANIVAKKLDDHRVVPAKYFGVPYFSGRIHAAGGIALPQKVIVSYLAEHSSLKVDRVLVRRLRHLAAL